MKELKSSLLILSVIQTLREIYPEDKTLHKKFPIESEFESFLESDILTEKDE